MNTKEFMWYAEHPAHGDLVLIIPAVRAYKHAYIYAPRIVFDRIGKHNMNPLVSLELNLGPMMGIIPRNYYEEAGFMVATPFWLRLLAAVEESREDTKLSEKNDGRITGFILDEWKKVYNSD